MDHLPRTVVTIGALVTAVLSSQAVAFIFVPVFVTLGAMYLKALSKKTYSPPETHVFGFDLGITACVTLIISGLVLVRHSGADAPTIDNQHYLVGIFVLFCVFVAVLVFAAYQMHKRGWEDGGDKMKAGWPTYINVGGTFLLIAAFVLTGGAFK